MSIMNTNGGRGLIFIPGRGVLSEQNILNIPIDSLINSDEWAHLLLYVTMDISYFHKILSLILC